MSPPRVVAARDVRSIVATSPAGYAIVAADSSFVASRTTPGLRVERADSRDLGPC
jgi:hypothetical protein